MVIPCRFDSTLEIFDFPTAAGRRISQGRFFYWSELISLDRQWNGDPGAKQQGGTLYLFASIDLLSGGTGLAAACSGFGTQLVGYYLSAGSEETAQKPRAAEVHQ